MVQEVKRLLTKDEVLDYGLLKTDHIPSHSYLPIAVDEYQRLWIPDTALSLGYIIEGNYNDFCYFGLDREDKLNNILTHCNTPLSEDEFSKFIERESNLRLDIKDSYDLDMECGDNIDIISLKRDDDSSYVFVNAYGVYEDVIR